MSRTPTQFWCHIFAIAAVLVSLLMVAGQLCFPFFPGIGTEIAAGYNGVGLVLFPLSVSLWVKLRFFPPLRSEDATATLLHWLFIHGVIAFLTGSMVPLLWGVEDGWLGHCLIFGFLLTIMELVLGLLLIPLLYFVFRKCCI